MLHFFRLRQFKNGQVRPEEGQNGSTVTHPAHSFTYGHKHLIGFARQTVKSLRNRNDNSPDTRVYLIIE